MDETRGSSVSPRNNIAGALGLNGPKNPVLTLLILLVESGLVYLRFQVSHFCIVLADVRARNILAEVLTVLTDSLVRYLDANSSFCEVYACIFLLP